MYELVFDTTTQRNGHLEDEGQSGRQEGKEEMCRGRGRKTRGKKRVMVE